MAAADLPIDGDGICMACKQTPSAPETLTCRTCATPWHVPCLSSPPQTLAAVPDWLCPDCSPPSSESAGAGGGGGTGGGLVAAIRAIEADESLTEKDKARRRQELMSGGKRTRAEVDDDEGKKRRKGKGSDDDEDVMVLLDEKFKCSFCMQLPERPVTSPCGHNFCLKCFQKWIGQGKRSCAKCRAPIPPKMASQPRINSALVVAIRMAKTGSASGSGCSSTHVYHFIGNENRPETAFTTERAKKAGKANACSGQIFVTIAPDHFGPILPEHDPKWRKGVFVGQSWEDRMECRQWGAHFPHVAGIAGQSTYGAQSVALSGGYKDDEDHGEWFLYTGSGGRDLSGNKRTNKDQSFDQKFEKMNEALRVSCKKGYPVRVVRSHKEKRSAYAPEKGVRYDGIYRIEKCWRKVGIQGFKVCRYLFVRCDNQPAPWTSDEQGDRPRPLPKIGELKQATDITERKGTPAWDYEDGYGWKWTRHPPESRKLLMNENNIDGKRERRTRKRGPRTMKEKLLREFSCLICGKVMTDPLTTPCAHNFCKLCLLEAYDDQSFIRERTRGGRTLRAQKVVKKCPSCPNDITDFVQNPQVNRELMDLIESLKQKIEENDEDSSEQESDVVEALEEDESNVEAEKDGSDDMKTEGMDVEEKELSNGHAGNMGKMKNKEQTDLATGAKFESANGDSEVHAANSEMEEGGEDECDSPSKKISTQTLRRRKQVISKGVSHKKTRVSEEASSQIEDIKNNQEAEDVLGSSEDHHVGSASDIKTQNKIQGGGSAPVPHCQNRRITRQMKLRGETW